MFFRVRRIVPVPLMGNVKTRLKRSWLCAFYEPREQRLAFENSIDEQRPIGKLPY